MRDPYRIPIICRKIEILWNAVPDWRLGQLISNATGHSGRASSVFNIEDDKLEAGLDELIGWYVDGTTTAEDK